MPNLYERFDDPDSTPQDRYRYHEDHPDPGSSAISLFSRPCASLSFTAYSNKGHPKIIYPMLDTFTADTPSSDSSSTTDASSTRTFTSSSIAAYYAPLFFLSIYIPIAKANLLDF